MSDWNVIFRDAVPGVAGVVVYDKGKIDLLGRYVIAKSMKDKRGRFHATQSDNCQRPAAVRKAQKFLRKRAALAGAEYVPGGGKQTLAFAPVFPAEKGGAL